MPILPTGYHIGTHTGKAHIYNSMGSAFAGPNWNLEPTQVEPIYIIIWAPPVWVPISPNIGLCLCGFQIQKLEPTQAKPIYIVICLLYTSDAADE